MWDYVISLHRNIFFTQEEKKKHIAFESLLYNFGIWIGFPVS
jgi:hypothetical protein